MTRISDALELLTAQHDMIDRLLECLTIAETLDERRRLLDELAGRLTQHLAAEQELFYPWIAAWVSSDVMCEVIAEHAEINRVLTELLDVDLEDGGLEARMTALQALLGGHVAWQEEELFTFVAETTSRDDLAQLGDRLHARSEIASSIAA